MRTSVDIKTPFNQVSVAGYDVVVLGAGPYGLSAAAHLRGRGLKVAIFGKPLSLWRDHMPEGMLLRSYWWATSLSSPGEHYDFAHYFQEHGQTGYDPLPREVVIEYGLWFQKHVVPEVDETYVKVITRENGQFQVELIDGRVIQSRAVVMAPGLHYYAYRPDEYRHLPAELVSHTGDYNTVKQFTGKRVIVIGRGQGALETAALAHEGGADIQLVCRQAIYWIPAPKEHLSLIERIRYPQGGIAHGWFDWGLEHRPYRFQRLERSEKDQILAGRGKHGPMGAHWLRERVVGKFPLHEMQTVQKVKESDKGVQLVLSSGEKLEADRLVLGTGYRVDIRKLAMLEPSLIAEVQTYQNAPVLNTWFESTVPGLYFIGISSFSSCGPLYRFVVGTKAAAQRVAKGVERRVAKIR